MSYPKIDDAPGGCYTASIDGMTLRVIEDVGLQPKAREIHSAFWPMSWRVR